MSIPDSDRPSKPISEADHAVITRLAKADLAFFRRMKRSYRVRISSPVEHAQLEYCYGPDPELIPDDRRLYTVVHKLRGGGVDWVYTVNWKTADPDALSEDACHALYTLIRLKLGSRSFRTEFAP